MINELELYTLQNVMPEIGRKSSQECSTLLDVGKSICATKEHGDHNKPPIILAEVAKCSNTNTTSLLN